MTELLVGTVLGVAALCYVIWPLLRPRRISTGAASPGACGRCGFRTPADATFCSECGAALKA